MSVALALPGNAAQVRPHSVRRARHPHRPVPLSEGSQVRDYLFIEDAVVGLASLAAAKSNFDTGDLPAAKTQLQWVIDNGKEAEARDVARLRLARVLLDEKNPAEALKLLETKHGDSFAGLYADVKGDALLAGGKRVEAHAAYQVALEKSDAASPTRQIVQLKLDALGETK